MNETYFDINFNENFNNDNIKYNIKENTIQPYEEKYHPYINGIQAVKFDQNIMLNDIDDIAFLELTAEDVVRHRLIGDIVKAYASYDEAKSAPRNIRNS